MAALNFETIINLTSYENNPTPKYVETLFIGNEPKNDIWQYYTDTRNRVAEKMSHVIYSNYDELIWDNTRPVLTKDKVKRIGIKSFPQIGAIGFFTLLNEERSKILIPIHAEQKKYAAPTLALQETDTTLIFTMTNPTVMTQTPEGTTIAETINYICYRIILRLGDFAVEYVTYEQSIEVSKPPTTGTYDIYCVGYINEGEATSEDSNHYYIAIQGEYDVWPGPAENHDLHITDVEVVNGYGVNIKRSDGFEKTSDNTIIHPEAARFTDDGYLIVTLSDTTTIVSDNVVPSSGGGGGGTSLPVTIAKWDYYYVTSTATHEFTYSGQIGNRLLLFILTRGALVTPPTDWVSLGDPLQLADTAVAYVQYVYVFTKLCSQTEEAISWEQEQTNTSCASCIELENAGIPVIADYTIQETIAATATGITCQKRTSDLMLFAAEAVYWPDNIYTWTCSDTSIWQIPNNGISLPRLGLFVDQHETPTPFTVGISMASRYISGFGVRIPRA